MKSAHKLTEGALLLAVFAILMLMTIYIPVLGVVTNLFLAIPFILFAAKNSRKSSLVFFVAAVLLSLIVGTVLSIPLTLSYGLTGLVMGHLIQEKKGRISSFIAATLVFLFTLVFQYAVMVALFEINLIKEFISIMRESIGSSISILEAMGQKVPGDINEQFEALFKMFEALTPTLFVMTSLFAVLLIELVSFPIVKRFGVIPGIRMPFKDLTLPKSILWYYLLTLLASFVFKPVEGDFWYLAFVNIAFILQLCMVIQGLSFIFYICYQKGISKAVPIIATIFTFLLPFFLSIVRILGIIDLGFELRERLENRK